MNFRRATLALLPVLFALVLPAVAGAAIYEVNSTADEADAAVGAGGCLTAGLKCTLRAAIEESNESSGVTDEIKFAAAFNGEVGNDTIAIASALPAIDDTVSILGGTCSNGPCAGVDGPGAGFSLQVEADGVAIRGLAITGALVGIDVINESHDFTAEGNWIGVKLDGTAGANNTGIFIDPGSDGATIGGSTTGERNVIAGNNNEGLDIEGASDAVISGNYFGVAPDGTTRMLQVKDIEITDSTASGGFAAENNEVGATIEGAALVSNSCDGGCNVISGAGTRGLDLNGDSAGVNEAPASGPTTVHGNFVGLNAAGTGVVENGGQSIFAGGADHVTVGADVFPTPIAPEANYVAGGSSYGIVSGSGGNDFAARGNVIGLAPDGTAIPAPIGLGIGVDAKSVTEAATIESNHIRMPGGIGIEQRRGEGRILENHVEGGAVGIHQWARPGGGLIAGNVIEDSVESGILLESPDTDVRRNSVFDSAGAGIKVMNPLGIAVNGSRIGNDTTEGENVIEGSGGPAIEIVEEATEPGSTTEIARNRGASNGGLFIDLVGGANEGIVLPAISAAEHLGASGTALPGATVRVFRKVSAEPGELQSFLAETVADGSGNWKVSYGSIPAGTLVAATQTNENGATSELATASVPDDPDNGGGGNNGGVLIGDPPCAFAVSKCRWPETTITAGPKGKIHAPKVGFQFKSDMSGSSFQCKLDRKPFKPCASPKKYKKLKPGKHVFKVRAIDNSGNVDPTPAKRAFKMLK